MRYLIFLSLLIFSFSLMANELKPYTVYLKPGTLLKDLKDNSEVTLSKGIYAQVLETNPNKRESFTVYNNTGEAKYLTSAESVVEIETDTRLLPSYDAQKIYPPKSVFKTENKTAIFDTQLNLHIDNLGLSSLNEIYSDEIKNVISYRYEIRTFYITDLPYDFGLSLNYQSAYWKNDIENLKISILSFGPHFQYKFYQDENFKANAILGAEVAPIYKGISAQYTDSYSAHLFDLGLETEWNTRFGVMAFGSHFRHHEIILNNSNRANLAVVPKEYSLNSFGVTLGYKIEWDL